MRATRPPVAQRPAGGITLHGWFRDTARRSPGLPALELGEDVLSYGRLHDLACALGTRLRDALDRVPRRVGLCCSRSLGAYVGYLGALQAGAAVVPLNPSYPVARSVAICAAADVEAVIVDESGLPHAQHLFASTRLTPIYLRDHFWEDEVAAPESASFGETTQDDLAYILFTSGSTGRPKGVPIRHRQLASYVPYSARRYGVGPGSRLSQTFELTFDPSVFDLFVAWYAGATVVVPHPEEILRPQQFVAERRISHWFSVPSVIAFGQRLGGLRADSMPNLRWSLFAGEQLTRDRARAWAEAAPNSRVENLYGPTELTITCTAYRLPRTVESWPRTSNGTVPIGRPYPHLEALVLDDTGHAGSEGELCLRGSQRFDGYLDPADDAGRFLRTGPAETDRATKTRATDWYRTGDYVRWENGELVHLGRIDEQVKIAGHRVEPGEIECVLRETGGVSDVVVVVLERAGGALALHALYCGAPGLEQALVAHARARLPAHMLPASVRRVSTFPTNANGKLDRRRVRELAARDPR